MLSLNSVYSINNVPRFQSTAMLSIEEERREERGAKEQRNISQRASSRLLAQMAEQLMSWLLLLIGCTTLLIQRLAASASQEYGSFDFVIVGAGPSGSALANRLSEIGHWTVLLLEAGKRENFLTDVPLLAPLVQLTDYNWGYRTEPAGNNASKQVGSDEKLSNRIRVFFDFACTQNK